MTAVPLGALIETLLTSASPFCPILAPIESLPKNGNTAIEGEPQYATFHFQTARVVAIRRDAFAYDQILDLPSIFDADCVRWQIRDGSFEKSLTCCGIVALRLLISSNPIPGDPIQSTRQFSCLTFIPV
jgi:hypothetical protein